MTVPARARSCCGEGWFFLGAIGTARTCGLGPLEGSARGKACTRGPAGGSPQNAARAPLCAACGRRGPRSPGRTLARAARQPVPRRPLAATRPTNGAASSKGSGNKGERRGFPPRRKEKAPQPLITAETSAGGGAAAWAGSGTFLPAQGKAEVPSTERGKEKEAGRERRSAADAPRPPAPRRASPPAHSPAPGSPPGPPPGSPPPQLPAPHPRRLPAALCRVGGGAWGPSEVVFLGGPSKHGQSTECACAVGCACGPVKGPPRM